MRGNTQKISTALQRGKMPWFMIKRSRFQGRQAIKIVLSVMVVLIAAHTLFGSNPLVPVLAVLTMIVAMWLMARYGVMNIAAILILLVAFRNVGFPLIAKLFMGQALDTNLDQPIAAYAAVLLGVMAYLGAVILANKINTGKPLLKPFTEPRLLRRLSFAAFVVGFIANIVTAQQAYIGSDAVTISNFFTPFLHLALIAAVAANIMRSNGCRILDFWSLIILATEVTFAFAINARTPIMEAFLCLVITAAAFRGHFSRKHIAGGLAVLLLLTALTPVILYVRGTRGDMTMYKRVGATLEALMNWDVAQSAYIAYQKEVALNSGSFNSYYGAPNNIFERFSHVANVDALISGADRNRTLGLEVLDQASERVMPRFLAPDKPRNYSEGDWINCEYGFPCTYGGYATEPLIGVGYATFGWLGIISFPFLFGLLFFLLIKKTVGFNLVGNIWVIYLLVEYNNIIVEGGASGYSILLFRQIPQDIVIMLALVGVSRITLRKYN